MTDPLTTTNVDVDAVPEVTVQESQAPAGAAGSPLPTVGTNAVSEWAMWDPNLWWTDWTLPPDPRPSWEQWFDWVNQLQALTPALGEASQDWQTMINQFDDSLRNVRAMRTELASWTGPSATTMSESLDRLEDSLTTKMAGIQNNPAKLQELSQTISDAVAPMAALDAEYQQVLQDLNACRQVAERGQPIMLNLATQLLQVGTDLENSVRTDNLAPQPVPQQPLTLTNGAQGPTDQLTQVAGSANAADPGVVTPAAQAPVADMPTSVGASGVVDPGMVQTAQQTAGQSLPGVAVGPAEQTANVASPTQVSTPATASPSLAGVSGGTVAPTVAGAPAPVAAMPTMASSGSSVMPVAQFTPMAMASGTPSGAMPSGPAATGVMPMAHGAPATAAPVLSPSVAPPASGRKDKKDEKDMAVAVRVPVPVELPDDTASTKAAVPESLRGRTGGQPQAAAVAPKRDRRKPLLPQDEGEPDVADVFRVSDAGTGTVTAPR